ncbi:MAG: enoyl-CoA hydratase [Deltaproteobacteria bacterium]|nr:enoyl-CoA hydratase [Deltaproteobacteria bacterium]
MTKPLEAPSTEPSVLREDTDGVATLSLNRPRQLNSLSVEMLEALQDELDAIARDEGVRVVILAGEGRAFSAGHDLRQMRDNAAEGDHLRLFEQCSRMMLSLIRLPQPVIARVQGIATAAGCQLVATCDLAVAAEEARFATSGIGVGLFCSTPAVALSRNVPRKRAFEMLFTGEFIDAATALDLGLVNQVVPAAELEAATRALAQKIVAKSPYAVRSGKEEFYRQLGLPVEEAYAYAAHVMARDMTSGDACEGIDAFLAKRTPTWRGR